MEELLNRISSQELTEWQAFYQMEPFGEVRDDYRMAILASVVANCHRGKKGRKAKPMDFMPKFGEDKEQTPEEMQAKLKRALMQAQKADNQKQIVDSKGEPIESEGGGAK